MPEVILETKNLTKTYMSTEALKDVNLKVERGKIHAVIGENGAGKSTLIHCLMGAVKPDYGDILLNGKKVAFRSPLEATQSGISAVYQELSVVNNMSIAENVFFNRQPVGFLGAIKFSKLYKDTAEKLKLFDIDDIDPRTLVGDLSMANKQLIEIIKAMSYDPKVLVLDEPTSSLTDVEVKRLFANIRRLKEQGVTFILISHHLNEIFEIADTISVFRDGKLVFDANVADVDEKLLVSKMVGRKIEDIYGSREVTVGEPCVDIKNISRKGVFEDISFSVASGEIVGFYGLVGAGRTEVGRAIFGLEPIESGGVFIDNEPVDTRSSAKVMGKIAYITEDRKQLGLYLEQPIKANLISNKLKAVSKGIVIDEKKVAEKAGKAFKVFNIVARDMEQKVMALSGGNQQKVLLAKWFDMNPRFLILDEPTRGVDVGAKSDIYARIRDIAKQGTAVMLISSDLPEVIAMSDRILVMRNGKIAGEIPNEEATEEKVLARSMGV